MYMAGSDFLKETTRKSKITLNKVSNEFPIKNLLFPKLVLYYFYSDKFLQNNKINKKINIFVILLDLSLRSDSKIILKIVIVK